MSTGSVTLDLKAMIDLIALGTETDEKTIRVTVDTGFTDYLMLPRDTILALGWPIVTFARVILANGTTVFLDLYEGFIMWEGSPREVAVLASNLGAPLIGMALLYGSRLTVDIISDGEVSIEPLS